jgi:hypothetical protein
VKKKGQLMKWLDNLSVWAWVCAIGMMVLAAVILILLGFSVWTALLVGLLLGCPLVLLWGAIQLWLSPPEG